MIRVTHRHLLRSGYALALPVVTRRASAAPEIDG
jgi:hypothetical protein